MEEEGGIGAKLSKRLSDKGGSGGEVDYKTKSGTAWSHSYLNQKPWHPLSYPNQRRKWIAEQTHANTQRRAEEVAREYAQEQDFFRQTALISKKEKEKVEMMQAVSFMYVRPPGFNAESAKAAEMEDERKQLQQGNAAKDSAIEGSSTATRPESMQQPGPSTGGKKKPRPRDVFGRALPTEEDFEVLKNAPRLETGVAGRAKPFAVELRNVKCIRCGNHGHQSGDRECPLKDVIMPIEENRLKRDDPLTAIIAHTDSYEPLKWELKQKAGLSPPRGGFKPDDPNQQIVAEDIYDEYGGFLGGENILELLSNFSSRIPNKKKSNRKSKQKRQSSASTNKFQGRVVGSCSSSDDMPRRHAKRKSKKRRKFSESSSSDDSGLRKHHNRSLQKQSHLFESSVSVRNCDNKRRPKHYYSSENSDSDGNMRKRILKPCSSAKLSKTSRPKKESYSSENSGSDGHLRGDVSGLKSNEGLLRRSEKELSYSRSNEKSNYKRHVGGGKDRRSKSKSNLRDHKRPCESGSYSNLPES